MKRKQKEDEEERRRKEEEDHELEEYYDEPFEQYTEDEEVRLTMRAPESDLKMIGKMYQDTLAGNLPDSSPSPIIKKR